MAGSAVCRWQLPLANNGHVISVGDQRGRVAARSSEVNLTTATDIASTGFPLRLTPHLQDRQSGDAGARRWKWLAVGWLELRCSYAPPSRRSATGVARHLGRRRQRLDHLVAIERTQPCGHLSRNIAKRRSIDVFHSFEIHACFPLDASNLIRDVHRTCFRDVLGSQRGSWNHFTACFPSRGGNMVIGDRRLLERIPPSMQSRFPAIFDNGCVEQTRFGRCIGHRFWSIHRSLFLADLRLDHRSLDRPGNRPINDPRRRVGHESA